MNHALRPNNPSNLSCHSYDKSLIRKVLIEMYTVVLGSNPNQYTFLIAEFYIYIFCEKIKENSAFKKKFLIQ